MASLLKVGRGAVRILTRRTVPASLPRPPGLDPTFDVHLRETIEKRDLWEVCTKAAYEPAKPSPVPPMEIRFDREQEVPILCRGSRPYYLEYAMGEPGLVHSDLNKYWVGEVLQELYTEAGQAGELGEKMDATLQVFRKFGSMLIYQLGTCCVRDKDGKLSVVVDDRFCKAVLEKLWKNPKKRSRPLEAYRSTGYYIQTVSKAAFEHKAFKVVTDRGRLLSNQFVQVDQEKFKGEEAKISVEVDRSALGEGNLLFFLPQAAAKNKFEVFVELVKAGDDVKGLELLELPDGPGELGCWYKLLPLCERLPWLTNREIFSYLALD